MDSIYYDRESGFDLAYDSIIFIYAAYKPSELGTPQYYDVKYIRELPSVNELCERYPITADESKK